MAKFKNPFSGLMGKNKTPEGGGGERKTKRKMIDKIKEEGRIARDMRREHEDLWEVFTDMYHSLQRVVTNGAITSFNTNRGHQLMAKMVSMLTARDPKWNVLPMSRDEEVRKAASFIRGYMSWYMYQKNVRRDVWEPMSLDTVITGTGITQVGFKFSPQEIKRRKDKDAKLADQLEIGSAMAAEGIPDDIIAETIEEIAREETMPPPEDNNEQNKPGEPFYQHIDTWDFYMAPGFTSIEQAWNGGGWVEKRIVIPLERAKADFRYKNRDQMKSTREIDTPRWRFLNRDTKPGRPQAAGEFVELFERHIAPDPFKDKPARIVVYSDDSDLPHWESEDPYPEIEGFPFEAVTFKPHKGDFFGQPYLKHLLETLDAFDLLRSYQIDIAKTKKPIMVGQRGIHDEADLQAIAESEAGHVMLLNQPEGFRALEMPGVSQELLNEVALLGQEISVGSNLGPNQVGGFAGGGASATEASIVQSNITADVGALSQRMAGMLSNSGRKFMKILQTKGDPDDIIQASNVEGGEFMEFTRDEIQGEFDIRVGAGTAEPVDEAVRRKQLLDMVVGVGNAFPSQVKANRILVDLFELFNLPSPQDYVVNNEGREQHLETAVMIKTKEPVEVMPGDEHERHIKEVDQFLNILVQDLQEQMQAAQQGEDVDEEELQEAQIDIQNLQEHRQMHEQFVAQRGGGGVPSMPGQGGGTLANVLQDTRGSQ